MTQDHPELNPLSIEHRLTRVEEKLDQRLVSIAEQLGNIAAQMRIANGRTAKNEEAIRLEGALRAKGMADLQDGIDATNQGIKDRAAMEASRAEGFTAGQQSVVLKLPVGQVIAVCAGIGTIAAAAGAVLTLVTK